MSKEITKVGFGLKTDFKNLAKTLPELAYRIQFESVVDLLSNLGNTSLGTLARTNLGIKM